MTEQPPSILERARALQAKMVAEQAAAAPPPVPVPPVPQFNPELIPDVGSDSSRSEEEYELDRVLDSIGIVDAYIKWCGKMTPKVTAGRTESIMISCPVPGHADKRPSAWCNTEKNTWYCEPCGQGGDVYDIAAFHHGYPVPGYKEGALFHKLRRAMGEDLGYVFKEKSGGGYDLVPPVTLPSYAVPPVLQAEPAHTESPVLPDAAVEVGLATPPHLSLVPPPAPEVAIPTVPAIPQVPVEPTEIVIRSIDAEQDAYDPELDSDDNIPRLDWRAALKNYKDTFLYRWCESTSVDYSPEEYHVFTGLVLLGFAAGRDTKLGGQRPVMANLPICFLGKTGSGKSTSQNYIMKALLNVMPENDMGVIHEGVKLIGEVGSGEALIGSFEKVVTGSQGATGSYIRIKGYVEFSELSTILAKASTSGSTLKTKIMDFIDGRENVSNFTQTNKLKRAYQPFASFTTSSQPRALRKLIDNQDLASGYLNRWVYVAGPKKERTDFIGGAEVDLRQSLGLLSVIEGKYRKKDPRTPDALIPWSPEARDAFNTFFIPVNAMLENSDDDMLARLEFNYKKIILCHVLNRLGTAVEPEDVAFMEVLHPYMLANYKLVGAEIGRSANQETVDRIFNYIKRKQVEVAEAAISAGQAAPEPPIGPSRSEMSRALKTKNITDKQINDAVDVLIKSGLIEEFNANQGKRGRPTKRVRSLDHA